MRRFVVAANWKMNKGPNEARSFLNEFLSQVKLPEGREVYIFPPAIDSAVVSEMLAVAGSGDRAKSSVKWGGQNIYPEKTGAFTGENSPQTLREMGASSILVGHSERRTLFGESDEFTAKKCKVIHELGMQPMLCVGESLKEREAGKTHEVIVRQLTKGLELLDQAAKVMIAYEPVWAIGTGRVATPEIAQEAHDVLRKSLITIGGESWANQVPILYGGSVNQDNAAQIAKGDDIDGFLVGGASLNVTSFLNICNV